jgi:GNAT superfamily N-acetyltransferase
MNAPTFRFAVQTDVTALVTLIERAYRGPETAGSWMSEAHLLRGPRTSAHEISSLIARSDSRFLVAVLDGRIIGCCLLQLTGGNFVGDAATEAPKDSKPYFGTFATPRETAPNLPSPTRPTESFAYFGMFAIDPTINSTGLGKIVLAEAERRVRELWNVKAMVMTVINVRDKLIEYYQRRGYSLTGARHPFPFSDTTGEVTRDFDLVEMRKNFA